jgi:flavin reductase (DIM6/NTAB) family NADH-FMN oxidoreductase RutF
MKKSMGAKIIVAPTPAWVVGTYDENGKPNVMTAAWAGVCCSKPPCIGVSLQKPRYSFNGIVTHSAFTINVPSETHAEAVDYFGISSGRNTDKFADSGLTPVRSDKVDAPYVEEFPLILECRLVHSMELGVHTQFIGEIVDVKADELVLGENGLPDIGKIKPMIFTPQARTYHGVGELLGQAGSMGRSINTVS